MTIRMTSRYIIVRPADRSILAAFTCVPSSLGELESAAVDAARGAGSMVDHLDVHVRSVWADRDAPCLVAVPEHVQRYDTSDVTSMRDAGIMKDFPSYGCVGALRLAEARAA